MFRVFMPKPCRGLLRSLLPTRRALQKPFFSTWVWSSLVKNLLTEMDVDPGLMGDFSN